jgi:integrase
MKPNTHPPKRDRIAVDPIRKREDIRAISRLISDSPRDHLLFTMGINNGLRAADLLRLTVQDVKHLKVGESISIKESKTGKTNIVMVNRAVYKSLQNYLSKETPKDSDYLFKSRKGKGPLQSQAVSKMVKKWTRAINLRGNYGAHTLRKTFGYIQRTVHGVGFEILCKRYNHSSPSITMRYLGIQDKEVGDILMHDIC